MHRHVPFADLFPARIESPANLASEIIKAERRIVIRRNRLHFFRLFERADLADDAQNRRRHVCFTTLRVHAIRSQ